MAEEETQMFQEYQKKTATWAVELPRDATIITREGEVSAKEGDYLALDSSGYPYPIDAEEFEKMNEPVVDSVTSRSE